MKKIVLLLSVLLAMSTLFGCTKTDNKDDKKEKTETSAEEKNEKKDEATENKSDDNSKGMSEEENMGISQETIEKMPQLQEPKAGEEIAVLNTNKGVIKLRLFPELAPKTVENFKKHIQDGYYDGIIFHRVIKDFMIQGGDPTGTGMGGESIYGEGFENEISEQLIHIKGALSMANTGQPNSNGSQFFIVQNGQVDPGIIAQMDEATKAGNYPKEWTEMYKTYGGTFHLDGKHTVFGQVIEGLDIVDAIANVKTGEADKPVEDVVIEKAEMVKY